MDKFTVTYTDTFGGEANYTWVKRTTMVVEDSSVKRVKRCAKEVMGLKGVRGRWEDYGDDLIFRPYGSCTVMFVNHNGEL